MSKEFINAVSSGDNLEAEAHFNNSMIDKVGNSLENRRKELSKKFKVPEKELMSYFEKEMLSI